MPVDPAQLRTAILSTIVNSNADSRLGGGRYYLIDSVKKRYPNLQPHQHEVMDAIWALVRQGLAFIDFSQDHASNWRLCPTKIGCSAVNDQQANPDNSSEYLKRLATRVPTASAVVLQYAKEAVLSYTSGCYLASTVMLGVASEAAFHEMARAFAHWLPEGQGRPFYELIEGQKQSYVKKFEEFRKRIDPHKNTLPSELGDGMALTFDAVLDLLRVNRNEAGHAIARTTDRDETNICLQMFIRYLEKMYAFKHYFDGHQQW